MHVIIFLDQGRKPRARRLKLEICYAILVGDVPDFLTVIGNELRPSRRILGAIIDLHAVLAVYPDLQVYRPLGNAREHRSFNPETNSMSRDQLSFEKMSDFDRQWPPTLKVGNCVKRTRPIMKLVGPWSLVRLIESDLVWSMMVGRTGPWRSVTTNSHRCVQFAAPAGIRQCSPFMHTMKLLKVTSLCEYVKSPGDQSIVKKTEETHYLSRRSGSAFIATRSLCRVLENSISWFAVVTSGPRPGDEFIALTPIKLE
nr:hypothetical protein Iba_chr14dCG1670 [Ipomoea batatas]